MGKDSKAIKQTGQLLSFVPTGEYYFAKGIKAYHRRDLHKAKKFFQRAMQLEPGEPMIVCQLAIVLTEMGEYQESIRLLQMILEELDEEMAECHYFLANNFAHMGFFKDAYHHANVYLELEEDGEFADDIAELLELITFEAEELDEVLYEEDDLIVRQDEARAHLESGHFSKAIEIFESLVEEYPEYWSAYNNLALAYFYLGEAEAASEILDEVLEKNPGNLHALCNGLVFSYYQNKKSEVNKLKKSLKKINPMLADQQYKLGATFALVGEYDFAYKWLKRLYKQGFEGDGAFYYWLSLASYYTGREQAARALWKKVLEFNPEKAGIEPWAGTGEERNSFQVDLASILRRLDSNYEEERLLAVFLATVSPDKTEILASKKMKQNSRQSALEKEYLHYVKTNFKMEGNSAIASGHQTAMFLYEVHQSSGAPDAGLYLLWFSVFGEAARAGLDLKNTKAWAAAVDFVWEKLCKNKPTKQATAAKYGLSVATLSKYVKLVNKCLR
ncbi:tetratricopeptide repeat protein [Bacillus sp. T33-2]|uniref:tetratricopeptide repeat protein n=1 Tax=Bacillus sp. T33-2 TaxID=2054168 RepID=UPI000C77CFC7|nr:tetratricopeptide repeat protein [Bacillus sp. T33-2]PLR99128.1 tetratricopeptide repeat protein [Bacillus sp. T33-2]